MHRLLGTPDEDVWPGVTSLPDYKTTFPNWHAKDLQEHITGSTDESAELLIVRRLPRFLAEAVAHFATTYRACSRTTRPSA